MKLNNLIRKAPFITLVFCLISFASFWGCRKSSPSKTVDDENQVSFPKRVSTQNLPVSKSLAEIIATRSSWVPILSNYYGKEAPDFKVQDINGKTHSLSDYRGKNVLIVMWASWCMPCMQEVPHLIALRDIMPEDKLAILAISNENPEVVKATAERKNMNYTVISHEQALPEPFSKIRGIPSSFFINPDGTIKLVTEGTMHLGETKSIILAE